MTEEEKILYGFGEIKNIVAIQQISSNEMRLYIREGKKIKHLDKRFYPFFFAHDEKLIQEYEGKYWKKRLSGDEFYKYIFAFEKWSDMIKALRLVSKNLNKPFSPKIKLEEIYIHYEPITQFLIQSGETLFKGMRYEDLKILYVKILAIIENKSEFHSKHFDQIFAISIADNEGWKTTLYQKAKSVKERDLLQQFSEIIQKKDPDFIVGYDLFYELAYLKSRFEVYGMDLLIGRDKSEPLIDAENKIKVGDKKVAPVFVSGRHVIDLLQLVSLSRTILRETENYSIQEISKYFGIDYLEEEPVEDLKIPFFADHQPQRLFKKIEAETEAIIKLSDFLLPQNFYQTQFVPMDFNNMLSSGVSNKIELMMVREYLRKRNSIPKAKIRGPISGGYTDVFYRGLFQNVIYADVESLYPSIIIQHKIYPETDKLKVFLKLVTILTRERLRLKHLRDDTGDPYLKMYYDTMQNSYKILINSFYGYLGFPEGIFNDFNKANEVTLKGQQLLKQLINEFQKRNCIVIEVDTDGLYISPQKELNEEEEKQLVEEINKSIPGEINLSFGGRFQRMLSYKKKNYALLTYDNKLIIKGSALIS
ncbi:MAG: DNA polymerase domain-containing protein, partial [Ignavibacteria bacterium]